MKYQIHVHNNESGCSQKEILIEAFLGIAESLIEIFTLGKVSVDFRYQWAIRCAERTFK